MLSILGSQLAVSALATLGRKSFEFGITTSLTGLRDVLRERFANSRALQEAQAELELKVRMLCLPVDILAHHVTQGNTALQEPLGVALGVLEDVEAFRQSLVQADVARAQDPASPDATTSAAQLTRRLRDLVARLDSVLPYLNLAVATVALLGQGASAAPLSASRLMAASWRLRSAPGPGAAVFALPAAAWHEERRLTAVGPAMAEVLRLCSLSVLRAAAPAAASAAGSTASGGGGGGTAGGAAGGTAGGAASSAGPFAYELLLQQDLEDGLYHEPGEAPQTLRLQVADIVALEWETTQSLAQGENEFRPALVLHVLAGSSSGGGGGGGGGIAAEGAAAAAAGGLAAPPDRDSATKAQRQQQQHGTPGAAGGSGGTQQAASRARSGRRAADRGQVAGEASPAKPSASASKGAGGALATPALATARPSPSGRGAGVGGTGIRRCAIMLNLQPSQGGGSEEEWEGSEGSEASSGGGGGASASDADSDGGSGGGRRLPPLPAAAASAAVQREWQLLGELEYVLRLCILECREQAPHQDVTDERIQMSFQATSVAHPAPAQPAAAAATAAAAAGQGGPSRSQQAAALAGGDSALQRRGSAAASRWRTAAAGAAHALREGVEAATQSFRQLSFSPAGSGSAAAASAAASEAGAAGGGVAGRTRSSSRTGGRGFGSPVQ